MKIAASGILPAALSQPRVTHTAHHSSSTSFLPWLLGLGVLVAVVALSTSHHSNNNNTVSNPLVLGSPQNALATLNATGTIPHVDLTFNASASGNNVQKYVITRTGPTGTVQIDTKFAAGGVTSFSTSDSNPTPGVRYSYFVQAFGFHGESSALTPFQTASGATTIVPGQPAPPTALTVTAVTPTSVTLVWNPSTDSFATGYQVFRSASPAGPYVLVSPLTVTVATFTDNSSSLIPGHTYYYKVQAVAGTTVVVNSTDSNIAVAVIP